MDEVILSIRNNDLVDGKIPSELLKEGVMVINLINCTNLTSLPDLPAELKNLSLTGCTSLNSLPDLPAGLERLDLSDCTSLTFLLENLPAGLKNLNLTGCDALQCTADLFTRLDELESSGCNVRYPKHFNKDHQTEEAKARLERCVESYKIANSAEPKNIKTVLHRFLSEGLGQRGVYFRNRF